MASKATVGVLGALAGAAVTLVAFLALDASMPNGPDPTRTPGPDASAPGPAGDTTSEGPDTSQAPPGATGTAPGHHPDSVDGPAARPTLSPSLQYSSMAT